MGLQTRLDWMGLADACHCPIAIEVLVPYMALYIHNHSC
jgi:hypothetical protein